MPVKVLMPALSPTMTEGKIARWLKNEGDKVKSGDVLAEIETDKATMEVEAIDDGTLGKIVIPGGTENVKVNDLIAVILEEGEDKGALANVAAAAPAAAAPKPAAPAPAAAPAKPQPAAALAPRAEAQDGRNFVSPLARRMAVQSGLDLGRVRGSGPHGRVVKADIEAALGRGGAAMPTGRTAGAPALGPVVAGPTPYRLSPHTTMRKVIAKRLTESKQTVPHYYLTVDCEIDALLKGRAAINAQASGKGSAEKGEGAYKISVNDFVIKAVALALHRVPAANASWSEDGILMYERADISVAVAIPGGLITPIIFDAANKGLVQISQEMKSLAQKAKENKLRPEEFQGGTFSISNLGMYGTKHFAAVINPPQAGIIAIGAGEQRPVVKNGKLEVATVMTCTLSADHRVIDGAVGAEFMAEFKKLIDEPVSMLL